MSMFDFVSNAANDFFGGDSSVNDAAGSVIGGASDLMGQGTGLMSSFLGGDAGDHLSSRIKKGSIGEAMDEMAFMGDAPRVSGPKTKAGTPPQAPEKSKAAKAGGKIGSALGSGKKFLGDLWNA